MYKKIILLIFILFLNLNSTDVIKKSWTFMTYIAGDNSLASMVNPDIEEMQKGANDNVNVLVYANVKENRQKLAKKIIVTKNNLNVVNTETNLDSGAASTFMKSLDWAISVPSDYLAIGLWGHGSGPLNPIYRRRGICFDDTTGNYLNDRDIKIDLETIVKKRGDKKIDILFFDACLMASLECMATYTNCADYIVASEQTIPGEGYNYKYILNYLSKGTVNPRNFASNIVDSYKQNYESLEEDYTLSAISTIKINLLARNVNLVAKHLINLCRLDSNAIKIVERARNKTIYFQEPHYIDLGHFYVNLLANINKLTITRKENKLINDLRDLIVKGIALIKQCVINNVTGSYYSTATGISIYFPSDSIDNSYAKLYWTEMYPKWNELIKLVLK